MNNSVTPQFTQENSFPSQFFDPKSRLEPRSLAYIYSGITTKHFSKRPKRRKVSESLAIKRETRLKTVGLLWELGKDNYADSMLKCGAKWSAIRCENHIAAKIPFHRCGIRFCPSCANRRANRFVKKYLLYVTEFVKQNPTYKPCLLTLTQKKIKGESKKAAKARIYQSFKQLIRRKFFDESFAGGIWTSEVTESETGNHSHLHIFIFRKAAWGKNMAQREVSLRRLKTEWAKVSLGAKNLNLKLIDDLENGLRETIKYISKPMPSNSLTLQSVKEILELKGSRMIDTFGEFRSFYRDFEIPETEAEASDKHDFKVGECCPHEDCGKPLYNQIMTDVEIIAYHRRREREIIEKIEAVRRL